MYVHITQVAFQLVYEQQAVGNSRVYLPKSVHDLGRQKLEGEIARNKSVTDVLFKASVWRASSVKALLDGRID